MSLRNPLSTWQSQCFPSAMKTMYSDQRIDLSLPLVISCRISNTQSHQENTTSLENHLITLDGLQVGLKRISRSNYVLLEDTCTSDFHLYKLCLYSFLTLFSTF